MLNAANNVEVQFHLRKVILNDLLLSVLLYGVDKLTKEIFFVEQIQTNTPVFFVRHLTKTLTICWMQF